LDVNSAPVRTGKANLDPVIDFAVTIVVIRLVVLIGVLCDVKLLLLLLLNRWRSF